MTIGELRRSIDDMDDDVEVAVEIDTVENSIDVIKIISKTVFHNGDKSSDSETKVLIVVD